MATELSQINRIYHHSLMQTEKFQPEGKRIMSETRFTGFIRVREMSGKFKIFQGQGIVREFHNLSGKI